MVLSLLLVAGVVTYVNTNDFWKTAADKTSQDLRETKSDNARLNNQVASITTQTSSALEQKNTSIDSLRKDVAQLQQQIAQRDGQIAELTANLSLATSAQTTANDALKAMQAAYAERSKTYDDLRGNYDKQQKQLVETSLRIDELTNMVDVTRQQSKFYGEQVAQLQQDLAKANSILKQNGISANAQNASATIGGAPLVPVTAKVEETKMIGGVKYATINIGSADSIGRNMQLKVVDPRNHQFLGYIVIDTVYPHQAIGRLEGPRVNDVTAQVSEVRSQL